jgi:hypothetical protein
MNEIKSHDGPNVGSRMHRLGDVFLEGFAMPMITLAADLRSYLETRQAADRSTYTRLIARCTDPATYPADETCQQLATVMDRLGLTADDADRDILAKMGSCRRSVYQLALTPNLAPNPSETRNMLYVNLTLSNPPHGGIPTGEFVRFDGQSQKELNSLVEILAAYRNSAQAEPMIFAPPPAPDGTVESGPIPRKLTPKSAEILESKAKLLAKEGFDRATNKQDPETGTAEETARKVPTWRVLYALAMADAMTKKNGGTSPMPRKDLIRGLLTNPIM